MISHIHNLHKLDKRFDELNRSCAQGRKAVQIAQNLVNEMKKGRDLHARCKQTRHGELRIRNCRKFDLGSGYRMVTVQQGSHVYLLYIGSHDECHQWIENHRGYVPQSVQEKDVIRVSRPDNDPVEAVSEKPECDYEDMLMQQIDDSILRWVFRGLCCGTS